MRRRRRWLLPFILLPTALGAATLVWSGAGAWKQNRLHSTSEMETGWSRRAMHDTPRAHAAGEAAGDQEGLLPGFDSAGQCHRPQAYAVRSEALSGRPLMIAPVDADENAAAAKVTNTRPPALDARDGRPGPRWENPLRLAGLGGLAGGGTAGGATGQGEAPHESVGNESGSGGEQDAGAGSDADTGSNDGNAAGPVAGLGEDSDHGDDNNSSDGGDDDESHVPSNPEWTYDPGGSPVQVTEPGTLGLVMLGLLGCMMRQRTA